MPIKESNNNYPIKCQYTNSEMHQFVLYPLHSAANWHISILPHWHIIILAHYFLVFREMHQYLPI